MFDRNKLSRDGAQAQALVLEKKVYASGVESGMASACRYELRVKFQDGSTGQVSHRAFGYSLASAAVGDIIPVRYDPADRSKIELDRHAMLEQQKARGRGSEATAIARGEQALGLSPTATPSVSVGGREPEKSTLRIGDADRERIAEVLSQHMTDGRLTVDELDDRLGALYSSQTREQARSVLADLPPLAPSVGQQHEAVPVLPDWAIAAEPVASRSPAPSPAGRPTGGVVGPAPTDGEMNTVYRRWRAKADTMKADKAAHQRAEASGDPREVAIAVRKLTISRAEEKSARAKFDQLRKRRPDWNAGQR